MACILSDGTLDKNGINPESRPAPEKPEIFADIFEIKKRITTLEKTVLQLVDITSRLTELEERFSELEDRVAAIDPMFPEYMSASEAAAYLSLSDWTIREMAKDQRIAYSKLHNGVKAPFIFERHDLDNYIAERRVEKHETPEIRT